MSSQPDCFTCRTHRGDEHSPGGVILQTKYWCLTHAIEPVPMAGWLVLTPVRHVEAFAELTEDEAAEFGPLLRRITRAMTEELAPEKIYLAMFMEAEGFAHLHVHLIPRSAETPRQRRGPDVFEYMSEAGRSGRNLAEIEDVNRLAASIREKLSQS